VRALVTSVMVGGSGEGRRSANSPSSMGTTGCRSQCPPPDRGPAQLVPPLHRLPPSTHKVHPPSCPVPRALTVDCDQHAAAVGRRVHPVVSHTLVFPGLAPLDVGNLQDLALRGEAVCGGGWRRGRGRTQTLNTGQHGHNTDTHQRDGHSKAWSARVSRSWEGPEE
jgi:hypothetical protein